jgi:hypothetical protein
VQAESRAVHAQRPGGGAGQPDGQQFGSREVGLGGVEERGLEPPGDGHD